MKNLTCLFLGMILMNLASQEIYSQSPSDRGARSRPGSGGSATLSRAGLKLGAAMPSINVFDDKGKQLNTGSFRGKYTVVTFGCLT